MNVDLDIIKIIGYTILPYALGAFLGCSAIYLFQKEKIYRISSIGWLDIKKHPIPHDIRGFIGTDGKKVDYIYLVKWGPYGEVFFSEYNRTYITHWQPLPDLPEK